MYNNDIVIVAAGRSAVGNFGSLAGVPASTLGAQVITAGLATLCIGGGMGIAFAVERA